MSVRITVRIKDRIGVVSEVSEALSRLDIAILSHSARVTRDRSGEHISVFRAELDTDDAETISRKLRRIKGFISFEKN